jgi:hypothetical protein
LFDNRDEGKPAMKYPMPIGIKARPSSTIPKTHCLYTKENEHEDKGIRETTQK